MPLKKGEQLSHVFTGNWGKLFEPINGATEVLEVCKRVGLLYYNSDIEGLNRFAYLVTQEGKWR